MIRYTPGEWYALVTGGQVAMLAPGTEPAVVEEVWACLRAGADVAALLQPMLRNGLAAMPPFAVVRVEADSAHAVVRGDARVVVGTAEGQWRLTGDRASTWVEETVAGAATVSIWAPDAEPGARAWLPVVAAVVRAAGVEATAEPLSAAAPAPAVVPVAAVVPEPAPVPAPVPEPFVAEPFVAVPFVAVPFVAEPFVAEPFVAEPFVAEPFVAEPVVVADPVVVAEPAVVPEPVAPPVPTFEPLAALNGFPPPPPTTTPVELPPPAALAVAPAAAAGSSRHAAPSVLDAALDDHDGMTVLTSDIAALRGVLPDLDPVADAAADIAPAVVAPPARIRLSTGQVVGLERPVLIGRAPQVSRVANNQLPTLVTVPSPNNDISRTHVQVRQDGDDVVITDLHSTNGVHLLIGGEPQRLHPGEPVAAAVGTVVDLGDGVTFTVEAAVAHHPVGRG